MTDPESVPCARAAATAEAKDPAPPAPAEGLTADQMRRWAALVAAGEQEFPQDLAGPDRHALAAEVRRMLRARLLAVVAGAIARDIFRSQQHDTEVEHHD